MGPWSTAGAYTQHFAICRECGTVTHYKASVDVRFERGVSERGFGFVVQNTDDYLITAEITTWQTVDFWKFDYEKGQWEWLNGVFSGSVRPGVQSNRIELEVNDLRDGRCDIAFGVNGRTLVLLYNQPSVETYFGLTLYGHSIEVSFDNLEFESYPPFGAPIIAPDSGQLTG
jgi:hypothetical protein